MDGLAFLKSVPNEQVAVKIFQEVFKRRDQKTPDEQFLQSLISVLKLEEASQAEEFFGSCVYSIGISVYENTTNLAPLFPEKFHPGVKSLVLDKILPSQLTSWRKLASENTISLPRLIQLDWRIDLKRASDSLSSMNIPTVLVQLGIENPTTHVDQLHKQTERKITFELNKQTLETLVDGLQKIKGQLNSLNN